ncbi:MAG: ATP-binding protein [Polyangiaceae bacterium]|nr:ATP-binding protein [Polyangiaceae bacterium]
MPRRFNTAGPNDSARHTTISARSRVPALWEIIEQGSFFVLHAPRQMGKTTLLLDLAAAINREKTHVAAVVSLEPGASFPGVDAAELAMLDSWRYDFAAYLPADVPAPRWPDAPPGNRIGAALSAFAQECPRPLVLFLDGLDTLSRDVRVSVIRQIRAGKPRRPKGFPWSIGFASLRDPRELDSAQGPSSATNPISSISLEAEVIALPPLSREQVGQLCESLSEQLTQPVLSTAMDRIFDLTQGAPFLVNSLAQRIIEFQETRKGPVTASDVDKAREVLLERRGGLLDEVAERMRDARFKTLLEQLTAGTLRDLSSEEGRAAVDLGIARELPDGSVQFANPIWRLFAAKQLPTARSSLFSTDKPSWVRPDGRLDPAKLLDTFLEFWRRHGDQVFAGATYGELSPLVLTAFLNGIVKSGGLIEREYALGRGRMDVCIRQGGSALAMVVKVRRDRDADPVVEGLTQVDESLARHGIEDGWLVIFDRRKGLPPVSQRLRATPAETPAGRQIVVVRV